MELAINASLKLGICSKLSRECNIRLPTDSRRILAMVLINDGDTEERKAAGIESMHDDNSFVKGLLSQPSIQCETAED